VARLPDGESLSAHLGRIEPRDQASEPAPEETEACDALVREPPAWKLNYNIGSGAFGSVFLEKVQTREMEFPELWAVKRILRGLQHFPTKQYQAEIKNLQTLSKFNVSFVQNCILS